MKALEIQKSINLKNYMQAQKAYYSGPKDR